MSETKQCRFLQLVRLALFTMLCSRALLYVLSYSSGPYTAILWYEDLMSPIIEFFGATWGVYAEKSEVYINIVVIVTGSFLLASSFVVLCFKKGFWLNLALIYATVFMSVHALCRFFDSDFELPMLMEYGIQVFAPLAYFLYLRKGELTSGLRSFCKVGISLCFLGHGLYAVGIPYQPAKFPYMLQQCLFVSYEQASLLVKIAGYIDFLLVIMIFISKLRILALAYMCFWGLVTASARVVAYTSTSVDFYGIHPWLWETTVRFIHGLAPLIMLLYYRDQKKE